MFVSRAVLSALLVVALLAPATMPTSAGTIPHEQFDRAELDLAVLKLLLNESLRLATESIWSCVYEDPEGALSYTGALSGSLAAPARIIQDLSEQVDSYAFLSFFLPPFEDMSADDRRVVTTFASLMSNLTALRGLVSPEPVPPEVYAEAMALLAAANSLVYQTLAALDLLEDDALSIGALPEIPEQGTFDVEPLLEAIDALREKLRAIEVELEVIASRLKEPVPKLFLNASSDRLYLGQTLILTGYLLYMGVFVRDLDVTLTRDGELFAALTTGQTGKFVMTWHVPIDPAYLGTTVFQASTVFMSATYTSSPVSVEIVRIPTMITLMFDRSCVFGTETAFRGALTDYERVPLAGQPVALAIDGVQRLMTTDEWGRFGYSANTTSLGFGTHSLQASYAGNATHMPSSTPLYQFSIKYQALLTLELSGTSLRLGETLTLTGRFTNLSLEGIAGAEVRIILDSAYIGTVVTGADGSYSFIIDTAEIGPGRHIVYSEHDGLTAIWFYTRSPERQFEVEPKKKPGLLPDIVAGTGKLLGSLEDVLKEAFFGKTAPFAWLLLLLLLIVAYLIYRRIAERRRLKRREHEERQKEIEFEPRIAPVVVRPLAKPGPGKRSVVKSTLARMMDALLGSLPPREAIIRGYARFLEFLGTERNTPIHPSLTHLEIQAELSSMGYPKESLGTVTRAYEKAMYTVRPVSVEEALEFADALADIEGYGVVGPA